MTLLLVLCSISTKHGLFHNFHSSLSPSNIYLQIFTKDFDIRTTDIQGKKGNLKRNIQPRSFFWYIWILNYKKKVSCHLEEYSSPSLMTLGMDQGQKTSNILLINSMKSYSISDFLCYFSFRIFLSHSHTMEEHKKDFR